MNPDRTLEQLRQVFKEAYGNVHTDFYRTLYAARGFTPPSDFPDSMDEWGKVPLLSKEDLAAVPVERRTFMPKEEVLFYRTSSGTSNRGVVIIPRNFVPDRRDEARFTKRILEFLMPHHFSFVSAERAGIEIIGGDPSDLSASAKLAALFHIDGISIAASLLVAFIPHLQRAMDTSTIRYVYVYGERVSLAKQELFFKIFPHARIETAYALSELSGIGSERCEEMARSKIFYGHPRSDLIYWELVDPDSGKPVAEYGEVVLTTLRSNNAFPALRYRTGDLARLVDFPCACGRKSYEILGRAKFDRAVIAGGLITSIELERALLLYRDSIEDDFQLHVYEDSKIPRVEFHIRPKAGMTLNLDAVAKNVAASLKISPHRTLADAAEAGLVSEVTCVLMPTAAVPSTKQLRIFIH